ncbi:YdhG-like domain-containing protein [Flavobacterium longum]|uniref:DUF1801 domain-containing protein n=1 Tax=Flavobacterium longum TaxID=1299340 RepID=UPI0039EC00EE
MTIVEKEIQQYIYSQPPIKRADMEQLHAMIQRLSPGAKLWFLDGKDSTGKVISNPNIGYGQRETIYADGKTREFYQIGLSANTTGISVYILGLEDKTYLKRVYGAQIGKASVTGYCVKFKSLEAINPDVLEKMILDGLS